MLMIKHKGIKFVSYQDHLIAMEEIQREHNEEINKINEQWIEHHTKNCGCELNGTDT